MTKRFTIVAIVIAVVIYTLLLCCLGVFGSTIATSVLSVVLFVGKWALTLLGYAFVVWLPFRIKSQLERNEKAKIEYKKTEAKIKELEKRSEQTKIEEAILKAYQKAEDAI